ncbi:mitochondrial matrix iron-sulfur protein [Malassezia cuniculi]|uniref:Mitochondrial matrix iron-sulfur protein n=1 Tax=Malassezia cuniculi TaxID=948313 RepID=A0AAF0ENE5_9BASI|nr:mitochondrial matrix iron-sulfur protein [Malassezia cuniculi]
MPSFVLRGAIARARACACAPPHVAMRSVYSGSCGAGMRAQSILRAPAVHRPIHTTPVFRHSGIHRPKPGTGVKVTFKDSSGDTIRTVEANEGDDILSVAHEYDIELEGACEGSIACSTCHVILEEDAYYQLEEPGDDENDMLDLAFGLTDTSRLGCQVRLTRELDGMTVQLPAATRNMYVDGAKPGH